MSDPINLILPNAAQMDDTNAALFAIAGALGYDASGKIKSFLHMRQLLRLGILPRYVHIGDLIPVNKESGLSVTVTGNVTGATVAEDSFLQAVGSAATASYEFLFDGAAWQLNGETVELAAYGVAVTGTPAEGSAVVVHVQADKCYFEVADFDKDRPANKAYTHSMTLISRDILSYGLIPFSASQALKAVAADEFPNGIAAGETLHLTLDHGAYDGGTRQDGSYQMVTPVAVPVGGKIRHTAIGVYQSNAANYSKETILAGQWIFYDANYNEIGRSATTEGTGGTSLGTATAETTSYMSGSHLNATRRQAYGSNCAAHSAQRKWFRSAAAGAASGAIASWWHADNEFDMPTRTTLPGFQHGLDPEFVECIGPVLKRTFLSPWDRSGEETYADTEETVFHLSMTEVGFGANSGVYETSPDENGVIENPGPYALYDGATNEDRIKRQDGTAKYWFLRSPHPSNCNHVRDVTLAGALNNHNALSASGAVGGLNFI